MTIGNATSRVVAARLALLLGVRFRGADAPAGAWRWSSSCSLWMALAPCASSGCPASTCQGPGGGLLYTRRLHGNEASEVVVMYLLMFQAVACDAGSSGGCRVAGSRASEFGLVVGHLIFQSDQLITTVDSHKK